MNTKESVSFAIAAATLLLGACSSAESKAPDTNTDTAQQSLVKCEGVNECKGTSECKSSGNSNGCQGLNDCKGQGFISIPKEECAAKNGKVLAAAPSAAVDGGGPVVTPPKPVADGAPPGTATASVKCLGINECKGHGDCAGPDNACKGLSECKGKGFLEIPSEAECLAKGGKVQA